MNKTGIKKSEKNKPVVKNLNVQISVEDYVKLQSVAARLGGMSLSAMMRMIINSKLAKFRATDDPKVFLDV